MSLADIPVPSNFCESTTYMYLGFFLRPQKQTCPVKGSFIHINFVKNRLNTNSSAIQYLVNCLSLVCNDFKYGGISVTKFNNKELISNYPNCTCISPKLNSNKHILCSKLGMHPTKVKGQKPISGIMKIVEMQKA